MTYRMSLFHSKSFLTAKVTMEAHGSLVAVGRLLDVFELHGAMSLSF